jgi:hypothetical protein
VTLQTSEWDKQWSTQSTQSATEGTPIDMSFGTSTPTPLVDYVRDVAE